MTVDAILWGQAGGGYLQQNISAPGGSGSVDVGDVNGDGFADMVFSQWGYNSATLRLGRAGTPGSWLPGPTVSVPVGANPFSARIGKLNGDSFGDLVVANGSNNSITVYRGSSAYPYLTGRTDHSTVPGGYPTPDELAFADVDNDADLDVLAVGRFPARVYVFRNDGFGALGPVIASPIGPWSWDARAVAVGDFNNDGLPDIVAAIQWDYYSGVNNKVAVLLGDGLGSFGMEQDFTVGRQPASVVTGDFNGDGWADFAVGNAADSTVTVMLNIPPLEDRDNDGIPDRHDNCPDVSNPDQSDTYGDARGDACEPLMDSDNDGIPDVSDNCVYRPNSDQRDTDLDGEGDVCDSSPNGPDRDFDGVPDTLDNCPGNPNPGQTDSDGDGAGDLCDPTPNGPDVDFDGIPDTRDNCSDRPNPTQVDADGDGRGDVCDPTPDGEPAFAQPFQLPDAAACLCTPVLMNLNSTGTQRWWVKADSTGTGAVGMRTFAVSVNNIDPETVEVHVYDAGGTEVAGSPVSTSYPGGTAPGTETFTDLGFSGAAGAIYRIDVTTPGTPSTQPHYRFEFKGAEAIGTTTATSPSLEEAHHTTWYFNTAAGEALDVRMFVTGTLSSETIVDYTLTDPLGVPTSGTATATLASDATIPAYAVAAAGTWSLLLEDKSTNVNPANGHYGLIKASGADTGVYLGWESYGEAHVTMDIPAAGVPAEVTFTNTVTGETFVFSGVNDGDVLDVPVGSYDVSATGPAGHEVTVSPSTIDLWCTLETELSVEVKNRLPRFTVLLPATLQKNEGPEALELQVAAVDDDGDLLEYSWTVTGPGEAVAHSPTATFTTSADGPSNVVVSVTAFDAYGGTAISQTTIQILNVAPVLGPISGPATPQLVGAAVSVSSTITDPGALDTFTCTINWGDGATTAGVVASGACGGTHAYAIPDVYTISMTVTDDDSGSDTEVFKYAVVYSGTGNVTGGGRFDSPAGFYAGQPTLAGRSNFGFNARYDRNGVLRGETEFQFRGLRPVVPSGDRDDDEDDDDDEDAEDRRAGRQTRTRLNFRSTSYDWLIVSGGTGMYVGSGRINGQGDYAFLVSIVDGRPDRFRIKIWDKGTGAVVYDNNAALADNYADPTFALSRGNVVIR